MTVQRSRAFPQVFEWDRTDPVEYLTSLRPSWMTYGACARSTVSMFPTGGKGVIAAKAVCARCPVKRMCLEYALEQNIDHGVWGGCGTRQRVRMRAERRVA